MSRIKQPGYLNKKKLTAGVTALFLALVPILCAWLYCLLDRQYFSLIYLPASTWNDELFYYKMTESILEYGYPQGYFGFNESHGMYLSFASWSPVLLLFWVIWGFFFGWNLLSPILCNLALLSIALFLFALLVKPDKKQSLMIALLYAAFMPVTRFALSCLPEAEVFALFIVFWGLAIACRRKYRGWMVGAMFALVMLMTWMRPYLILLLLTPAVLLYSQKGKRAFLWAGGTGAATMVIYVIISHFFSAPYFEDLYYTEWIAVYFEQGIFAGLRYTLWKLYTSLYTVVELIRANMLVDGLNYAAGLYYLIFLLLLLLLLARVIWRILYKNFKGFLLEGQMLFCMAGFFAADLLMYRIREGGRHTLVYIVGFVCLLPFAEISKKKRLYLTLGTAAVFFGLFLFRGDIPAEFEVPYRTEEYAAELENLAEGLSENMVLTGEAPNYENTIIWVFTETINGKSEVTDYGAYYALPKGFGINLCTEDYVAENPEALRSRYIGVIPEGNLEGRIKDVGGTEIGRCRTLVIYDMQAENG